MYNQLDKRLKVRKTITIYKKIFFYISIKKINL